VPVIVITGAAGLIGSMLRPRLAAPGRTLRLLDVAPLAAGPGEEAIQASVADLAAMTAACDGADAVIHLAGIPGEAPWPLILETNINGSYVAFEAARRAGTPRVIFASSNHAVGFTPSSAFPVPDYAFPAPDTYYGVSKVTGEGLAALYHYRYGLDTVCLRILSCFPRPMNVRMLSTWLSPDDAGRLFEACLTADRPGFRVAFGVSANTRGGWVSLAEAKALGYEPRDDAEEYAAEVIAEAGPDPESGPDAESEAVLRYLGGEFTLPDGQIPGRLPSLGFLFGVDAVQADGDGDHQGVVLAGCDVHAVGVADPEPRPGDLRRHPVPVADLEVLVDDVADRLEPPAAREIDVGPVVQRREHRLVHGGHHPAAVLDLHRVGEGQQLVLDRGQRAARGVLELEGVVQRQDFRVDEVNAVPVTIGHPEVVLDREDLLPHQIAHDRQAIRARPGRRPSA
jgi:uronate dehydrogenase